MKDKLYAAYTAVTTILDTILLGIPTIILALFSKTGVAPYYTGKTWSWLLLKVHGVKVQIIGLEKIMKKNSYVFISNHQSHLDTPAVASKLPNVLRFVAKGSLANIPLFGQAARLARMIFIDRDNPAKSIAAINDVIEDLKNGISAYFFAEGTRSDSGIMGSFKKGGFIFAIKAKLPIVPITVIGGDKLLPRGKIGIRSGVIQIILNDPIETSSYNESNTEKLMKTVEGIIKKNIAAYSKSV